MSKNLFSKEFLEDLYEESQKFSLIDYIMESKKLSFHEAILELAKYCELTPEYFERRKS